MKVILNKNYLYAVVKMAGLKVSRWGKSLLICSPKASKVRKHESKKT